MLLQHAEAERDQSIRELDDALAERDEALARIQALQSAVSALKAGASAALAPVAPKTLDELVAWMDTDLGSNVVVLPKAIRETRRTKNVNIERLHTALVMLRDAYVPMRKGDMEPKAFRSAMRSVRLDEQACFAQTSSILAFEGYEAIWQGRRIVLDRHIKWGIGTQMEKMLRVYFYWDESTHTAVIGHMPTHLDNWNTN